MQARRQFGRAAFACMTAGALAAPAWSQLALVQGVRVPPKPAAERKIDYSFDLSTLYDSNIARSDAAIAQARGLHRSDERLTPEVGFNLQLPLGQTSAYFDGTAGYDFYARNHRLNGERIIADGGVSHNLGTCTLALDANASRVRTDLSDIGNVAGELAVQDFKNIETTLFGGLTATCGGDVGLKPTAQIDVTKGYNSNQDRAGSDFRTMTYGGGLLYAQPSIGEVGILGSIERTTFDNRGDGASAESPDLLGLAAFSVRSIGIYADRAVTSHFAGRLRINYSDVDAGRGVKSFSGISGEASAHIVPDGVWRFDLGVSRAAVPALSYDIDYYVETLATASVTTRLADKVEAALSYQYRHRKYYSTTPNLINPLDHDDDHEATASLTYDFRPHLQFALSGVYETRNANGSFYDFHSKRALFTIRFTH